MRTTRFGLSRTRQLVSLAAGALLAATVASYAVVATEDGGSYVATWLNGTTLVANPPNQQALAPGSQTVKLRITNRSEERRLGSVNITPPVGYTLQAGGATTAGTVALASNVLQLRNLNLARNASADVTVNLSTGCLGDGVYRAWSLVARRTADFSVSSGGTFSLRSRTVAPASAITSSTCMLRS